MKNWKIVVVLLLTLSVLTACAASTPAEPPENYDALTFSFPYLAFAGRTRGEMADELPLDEGTYDLSGGINVVTQEPVTVDGVSYTCRFGFDPSTVGFDNAAYQEDPSEADHAALSTASYTYSAPEQDVSAHVRAICDAMTAAYGAPFEAPREEFRDEGARLAAYLENPLASGTYSDIWIAEESPEFPEMEGWTPAYLIAYVTVASGSSGTDITVSYRAVERLPDTY